MLRSKGCSRPSHKWVEVLQPAFTELHLGGSGNFTGPFGRRCFSRLFWPFHKSIWADVLQPASIQLHLGRGASASYSLGSFGRGCFSRPFYGLHPAISKVHLGGRASAVHYTTRFGTGCFSRLVHRYVRAGVLQPAMKQLKPTVKIPKSKTWPNMNVLSPRMDTSSGPHCSSQACQRTFCNGTRMRSGCQWFAQRTACVCEAVGLNPRPGLEAHSVGCRICCLELYLHRAL